MKLNELNFIKKIKGKLYTKFIYKNIKGFLLMKFIYKYIIWFSNN